MVSGIGNSGLSALSFIAGFHEVLCNFNGLSGPGFIVRERISDLMHSMVTHEKPAMNKFFGYVFLLEYKSVRT